MQGFSQGFVVHFVVWFCKMIQLQLMLSNRFWLQIWQQKEWIFRLSFAKLLFDMIREDLNYYRCASLSFIIFAAGDFPSGNSLGGTRMLQVCRKNPGFSASNSLCFRMKVAQRNTMKQIWHCLQPKGSTWIEKGRRGLEQVRCADQDTPSVSSKLSY